MVTNCSKECFFLGGGFNFKLFSEDFVFPQLLYQMG